jgi:4-amino-4-deoxychorismate lyase
MKISVNGSIYNEQEAVVSVYDHGFLYGLGLFETFRTYGSKPFLLKEHLERLEQGCIEIGIAYTPNERKISEQITQLLEINQLNDAYIRLTVSAGVELLGLPSGAYTQPTEIIYIKQLARDEHANSHGKALQLLKLPRNTPEGLYRLKSLHYMNNILAKRELQTYSWAQGAEGLMLTDEGYVAEGIVSNVIFIRGDRCCTPSIKTGILPGITRAAVLQEAAKINLIIEEGMYRWEDLMEADEIFIVNSIQEIVPITRLYTPNGQLIQIVTGKPGPYTSLLQKQYGQMTGSGI